MVDRFTAVVKDFDPTRHQEALLRKMSEEKGPGWEVESFDPTTNAVTLIRHAAIAETTAADTGSIEVKFPRTVKPSDGPRQAARLEDANPGYYMTSFEPFLGKATLSRLTDAEARCRGAVAVALGVQPWEVQVKARPDGGFDLGLPPKYQPGKAEKLQEVASEVVGREGWYAQIDAQALTASIIPSDPPTFPAVLPTPIERIMGSGPDSFPIGRALPDPGQDLGRELVVSWGDSSFLLVGGVPKGGKSQIIISSIFHGLCNGSELVVIDDEDKAADYRDFKPFCRRGGWGVSSPQARVAALGLVNDEIKRRAGVLDQMGLNNWLDMPAGSRFAPILVVVDELSLIVPKDPPLKSLPQGHPLRVEVESANIAKDLLQKQINDLVAKARFVGVRMVLSSQILNEKTGAGPTLRGKFGNFLLLGASQPESSRSQVFANPKEVPYVPINVASDTHAARGVGVASLWGEVPAVFKGYYRPTADLIAHLRSLGLPTLADPAPSAADIDRFMPVIDEDDIDDARAAGGRAGADRSPVSGRTLAEIGAEMGDPAAGWDIDPETGKRLTGFERANAARAAVVRGS